MENKRRQFLKLSGLGFLGIAGGGSLKGFSTPATIPPPDGNEVLSSANTDAMDKQVFTEGSLNIIGPYGAWASSLNKNKLPAYSFRKKEWDQLGTWKKAAKKRATERMAIPAIGGLPKVTTLKQYEYDGLHIEELSWQLPYGRATEALLLKPLHAKGPLPAILAFHDHGGNKYFGTKKITQTNDQQHPLMKAHQQEYYEGFAWANEIAKLGYAVLVADAFTFASRKVMLADVPEHLRKGLNADAAETPDNRHH